MFFQQVELAEKINLTLGQSKVAEGRKTASSARPNASETIAPASVQPSASPAPMPPYFFKYALSNQIAGLSPIIGSSTW